jgi:hypothetical protein
MSSKKSIRVGYTNQQHDDDYSFPTDLDSAAAAAAAATRRDSYVEFHGMTRVRSGTATLDDHDEQSEKIIHDIVAMDASFDPHELPDLSVGTKKLFSSSTSPNNSGSSSNSPVKAEKYGNFHTIDWLRDLAKDRFRHRWIVKEKNHGRWFEKIRAFHDACSGWFCVLLVGMSAGIVAGVVDIGSGWTYNLKTGVCRSAFWLNRDQCCWSSTSTHFDDYKNIRCDEWTSWANLFGYSDGDDGTSGHYIVSFVLHVFISLIFAFMAAILVKFFGKRR